MNIDQHKPGSFCWIELGTTDQNAAKQFYEPIFGWKANDFPMGPGQVYTMFRIDGRDAAAVYTLDKDMQQRGVPPHWMPYIAVANVDEISARAIAAGGTVIVPSFDVMDFGRMAVLQDPTGAVFSVWEARRHHGTGITNVPGTMCWADLSTPDTARAAEFYKALFGWDLTAGNDDYLHIKNGEDFIGGIPPATHRPPNVPPHWMTYFTVANCDASTEQAKAAGGTIRMGPMNIEKVGRMSVISDPQGATFAFFQPTPH